MAEVTFEESKRCPKCGHPGNDRVQTPLEQGHGTMHYIYCETPVCPWYNSPWMVQTMPNGEIAQRDAKRPVTDLTPTAITPDFKAAGQRYLEDLVNKDLRGSNLDK